MTSEQIEQRLREIMKEVEAKNPYDTFEPHEAEEQVAAACNPEQKLRILDELYDARLQLLWFEAIEKDPRGPELIRYFLKIVADAIISEKH